MSRKAVNPRFVCPQCGRSKDFNSRRCADCSGHSTEWHRKRMRDFITRFANGQTFKEIALAWQRSESTVEYFWARAKAEFNLQCPQDAVWCALRLKWVSVNREQERSGIRDL